MFNSRKFMASLLCFILICTSFGWPLGKVSAAALSWTKIYEPFSTLYTSNIGLKSVIYGDGKYVAVGVSGSITTSEDAVKWSGVTPIVANGLTGVSYGNEVYVAVGGGGTILYSSDGRAWSKAASGTTKAMYSVKFLNERFWATAESGVVLTSSNGISWTQVAGITAKTSAVIVNISYGGGKYVIGDINGKIYDSVDGIT